MNNIYNLPKDQALQKSTASELKAQIETRLKQLFPQASAVTTLSVLEADKLDPVGVAVRFSITMQVTPLDIKEPPTEK